MKRVVMPAQVTSVEDRIIGRLSVTQLILCIIPLLLSSLAYVTVPPFYGATVPKIVGMGVLTFICFFAAFRYRSRLILQWVEIIGRYAARPQYYVHRREDSHSRVKHLISSSIPIAAVTDRSERLLPAHGGRLQPQTTAMDPTMTNFKVTRKGKLYAIIPKTES